MIAFAIAFCAALWTLSPAAVAGDAPREVHGSADAYAAPGVALAWGVLRGADEATTAVIIRIDADPAVYPWLSAMAIDPFSKAEVPLLRITRGARSLDVRVPRAQFADYPRSELRFFVSAATVDAGTPQLVVFYLGVPDTTPEFTDAARLDSDLNVRIARARAAIGSARP